MSGKKQQHKNRNNRNNRNNRAGRGETSGAAAPPGGDDAPAAGNEPVPAGTGEAAGHPGAAAIPDGDCRNGRNARDGTGGGGSTGGSTGGAMAEPTRNGTAPGNPRGGELRRTAPPRLGGTPAASSRPPLLREPSGKPASGRGVRKPSPVDLAYRCAPCGAVTTVPALRRPVLIRKIWVGAPRTLKGCPSCGSREEPVLVALPPESAQGRGPEEQR